MAVDFKIISNLTQVGQTPQIAISSGDNVSHVVYYNASGTDNIDRNTIYCNDSGGTWTCMPIARRGASTNQTYPTIAIGSAGVVHIAFANRSNNLVYCNNSDIAISGVWKCNNVGLLLTNATTHWANLAMSIDKNNVVHIAGYNNSGGDLQYCNNSDIATSGIWKCIKLAQTQVVGQSPSIATDNNNITYIVSRNITGGTILMCNNSGGAWTINTCGIIGYTIGTTAETTGITSGISLAIDSNNYLHMAFHNLTGDDLGYCNKTAGNLWTCTNIETSGTTGRNPSIAIDGNNGIHIISYNYSNSAINQTRYCNSTTGQLGTWKCDWITATNLTGNGVGPFAVQRTGRQIAIKTGRLCNSTAYLPNYRIAIYNLSDALYGMMRTPNCTYGGSGDFYADCACDFSTGINIGTNNLFLRGETIRTGEKVVTGLINFINQATSHNPTIMHLDYGCRGRWATGAIT